MKANKFRELSDAELQERIAEFKSELFNLRFQLATGQLENPMRIKEVKRNIARVKIARVKTILRERELKSARMQ
jgi:large subunit ribosomal protein L29